MACVAWRGVAWRCSLLRACVVAIKTVKATLVRRVRRSSEAEVPLRMAMGSQRQVCQAHQVRGQPHSCHACGPEMCAHLADHVRAVPRGLEALGQRGLVERQRLARAVDEGDVNAVVEDVAAREERGARRTADGLNVVILETDAGRA